MGIIYLIIGVSFLSLHGLYHINISSHLGGNFVQSWTIVAVIQLWSEIASVVWNFNPPPPSLPALFLCRFPQALRSELSHFGKWPESVLQIFLGTALSVPQTHDLLPDTGRNWTPQLQVWPLLGRRILIGLHCFRDHSKCRCVLSQ